VWHSVSGFFPSLSLKGGMSCQEQNTKALPIFGLLVIALIWSRVWVGFHLSDRCSLDRYMDVSSVITVMCCC
jgi:hypothetical protein